jgi:hypothetical protein
MHELWPLPIELCGKLSRNGLAAVTVVPLTPITLAGS